VGFFFEKCLGVVNSTICFGNLPLRLQIPKKDIVQQYLENKHRGKQYLNKNRWNKTLKERSCFRKFLWKQLHAIVQLDIVVWVKKVRE